MRSFVFFFIVFTLTEISFSACYYMVAGRIDITLIIGAFIYLLGLLVSYLGIRSVIYNEKRKALIDSLPG